LTPEGRTAYAELATLFCGMLLFFEDQRQRICEHCGRLIKGNAVLFRLAAAFL
jgi:hypothetical protein